MSHPALQPATYFRDLVEAKPGSALLVAACLDRDRAAIQAHRCLPWWRVGILLRRPWRAGYGPGVLLPFRGAGVHPNWFKRFVVAARNLRDWLRHAHDCSDPAVMCNCSGSFRFPSAVRAGASSATSAEAAP